MMDRFSRAVRAEKDPEVKSLLKDVCDLYAVHTMRKNAIWYVENGFMKSQKTKALAEMEEKLCEKIRPHAQTLTAAFDIPPSVLGSPKQATPAPAKKKSPGAPGA